MRETTLIPVGLANRAAALLNRVIVIAPNHSFPLLAQCEPLAAAPVQELPARPLPAAGE